MAEPTPPFYSADTYHPEESVGFLMRQVLAQLSHEIERQFAPSDLTNAQWIPLFKLYNKRASTVAELARQCSLDGGAMTRTLDRLEAKGLCERVRSEDDRRVVNIHLTEAGRQAAAGIPTVLCHVQNTCLEGFSVEEFETLKSLMQRILVNASALSQQPIHPLPLSPETQANGGPDAA
jgi:DNA-binding MarR family transcriptional regulator